MMLNGKEVLCVFTLPLMGQKVLELKGEFEVTGFGNR